MNNFISALEQENPVFVMILIGLWWPERLQSMHSVFALCHHLHGAQMFSTPSSEAEDELRMLHSVAHHYAMNSQ